MTRRKIVRYCFVFASLLVAASCAKKSVGPMEMGMKSFESHDYSEARLHFQKALTRDPDNPKAVYYLGRIALESGELDEAIEHLKRASSLDDGNSEYHFRLGIAYAQKIQQVESFFEKGQIAPLLKNEFERAVETDPENVEARMALAQYFLNAPPIAGGSTEKAMEQIEAIAKLDPRRGHLFKARLHSGKKEYGDAEREYKAALELDPQDAAVYYEMGMLHQTNEDYTPAFRAFEKALAIDPSNMQAAYQIGRTAIFSGENLSRGVECMTAYLGTEPQRGQPTWAHAHWRLGSLYEKLGDAEKARKHYRAALELDPGLDDAKEALEGL